MAPFLPIDSIDLVFDKIASRLRRNEVVKGRSNRVSKTFIFGLIVSLLFLPVMAEENESQNKVVPAQKMNYQIFSTEDYLVPLESESPINSELFQLIKETSYPKTNLNFNLIRFESPPISSDQLKKMIKLNRIENSLYTTSLITMTALNVADYVSTLKALKYDSLKEANPLMKPFTKNALLFTAVKLGLTAYNYHWMKKLHKKDKRLAWAVCLITNFAMTYIVINNLKMIQRAQAM